MNRARLLRRLHQGAVNNVAFGDMVDLLHGFGFEQARVNGSHHIFRHAAVPAMLNLQDVDGEAKPYQIRQFLRLIEEHNLTLETKA